MKDMAKVLADRAAELQREAEARIMAGPTATQLATGQPTGLTGTGITLQALMQEWWKLEADLHQACPWMRWAGKAELRLDEAGWLPKDWLGVVMATSVGCIVFVKPAALAEVKKAWVELAKGEPYSHLFREPTDQEIAAMFAWLAEVQAAREGKAGPKPEGSGFIGLNTDVA